MKKLKIKKMKGFTLVELIIVITILAILATIAFVSFQSYTKGARDSNRVATINSIGKGLDLYQVSVGNLPTVDDKLGTGTISGNAVLQMGYIGDTITKVIKLDKVPTDPGTNTKYVYGVDYSQTKYQVGTISEDLQAMRSPLFLSAYADGGVKARVIGNYNGLLKYNGKLYNIPSLLITFSGSTSQDLLASNTNYVIDKAENLPYLGGQAKVLNTLSTTQVLQKLTNTGASLTVTGVTLPTDASNWNATAPTLQSALGYGVDTIGQAAFGNDYFTTIKTTATATTIVADICQGKTVGAQVTSSGMNIVCAGTLSGNKYMTTPGGCTDSPTPTCNGTVDTVQKRWGKYGVVTGITSETDGMANTILLMSGYTVASNPNSTEAAKYCYDMVYGGYSDWYLPANAEMTHLFNNRFNLGGFRTDTSTSYLYISSTERDSTTAKAVMMGFMDVTDNLNYKGNYSYLRCVRKY